MRKLSHELITRDRLNYDSRRNLLVLPSVPETKEEFVVGRYERENGRWVPAKATDLIQMLSHISGGTIQLGADQLGNLCEYELGILQDKAVEPAGYQQLPDFVSFKGERFLHRTDSGDIFVCEKFELADSFRKFPVAKVMTIPEFIKALKSQKSMLQCVLEDL